MLASTRRMNHIARILIRYRLHQYLPDAVEACRARGEALTAENLIRHHIRAALVPYYAACV